VARAPWQFDEALTLPNAGLAILLLIRGALWRRETGAVVGVGTLAAFLGVALGAGLHRFSLVSQVYSVMYLVAIVWLHVVLTLALRRSKGA